MNTEKRTNKFLSKLIVMILAAVLALSGLFLAACSGDGDSTSSASPSASPTPKPQSVGNGNFDLLYDNSDSSDYPRTPKEWSYSIDGTGDNKAPDSSSDLLHGIVSVNAKKFGDNADPANAAEDGNKKFGRVDNPKSPSYDPAAESNTDKGNVLMMYNKNQTAVRYKSPAISIAANSYVEISMWVKTAPLYNQAADEPIAHINITGGLEEPLYVKNINTSQATDNGTTVKNGYVQYKFYIASSAYQSKTIYVELGMGYGDKLNTREHSSGYAFFDDVQLSYLSQQQYAGSTAAFAANQKFAANGDPTENLVIDSKTLATPQIAYSYSKPLSVSQGSDQQNLANLVDYSKYTGTNQFGTTGGSRAIETTESLSGDGKPFATLPFAAGTKILKLTNDPKGSFSFRQDTASALFPYKYFRISFWVKTDDFKEGTAGLNIVLANGKRYTTDANGNVIAENDYKALSNFAGINTTKSDKDLTDSDVTKEYKWENWQQYSFLVETSQYAGKSDLSMEFYLGPQFKDKNSNTFDWQLVKGSAYITEPQVEELTSTEYSSASTGDTAKKVSLKTSSSATISNGSFSTPANAFGDYNFDSLLSPIDWTAYPHGLPNVGGDGSKIAPNKETDVVSGITNKLLPAGASLEPNDNPTSLAIRGINSTALGYASTYLTMSADKYYKLSVDVMADVGTKYGVYLVEKTDNKKLLGDGGYKNETTDEDGNKFYEADPNYTRMFFTGVGTGVAADGSKWMTYSFYFKTVEEAKNFRIELWLGDRQAAPGTAADQAYTSGTVYFDNVVMTEWTEKEFNKLSVSTDGITVDPSSLDAEYRNDPSKLVNYTNADTKPETSPSPSPSASETPEEGATFNWAAFSAGMATLLMVIALAIVGVKKFILDPKKKGKGKAKKDKNSPDRKNKYSKEKKHYEHTETEVESEDDEDEDDLTEEESEDEEESEASQGDEEQDSEDDEDDLDDVTTDHLDEILEDDDKKNLD